MERQRLLDPDVVVREMLAQGLLVSAASNVSPRVPVKIDMKGEMEAVFGNPNSDCRIRVIDAAHFALSCARAALALRLGRLDSWFCRVVERKRRASISRSGREHAYLENLVSIFRAMRPYVFAAENKCLFHSMALVDFLAHYNCFPTLVIGVKTNPWGAHSWVQDGASVLDSTPEKIFLYTPIFAA
jgi:hypothetical protein